MADNKSMFGPLNLDPKAGDMTDIIFKSAQMSLEKRERQRQAIKGVVDTFMTVAKLNQEKTRMEMQDRVAQAGLGETRRQRTETERHNKASEAENVAKRNQPGTIYNAETDSFINTPAGKKFEGFIPRQVIPGAAKTGEKKQNLTAAREIIKDHFNNFRGLAKGRVGGAVQTIKGATGIGEDADKIGPFKTQSQSNATIVGKLVMGEDRFSDSDRQVFSGLLGSVFDRPGEMKNLEKDLMNIVDIKERSLAGGLSEELANAVVRNELQKKAAEYQFKSLQPRGIEPQDPDFGD